MIGIISAMIFEKKQILDMINVEKEIDEYGIRFSFGSIGLNSVVVAACGEGKVNAARCAQIMICCFGVNSIINIGVAGSMNIQVKKSDIVIAKEVVQHDYNMSAIGVPVGLVPEGTRTGVNPWGEKAQVYTQCSDRMINSMANFLKSTGIRFHIGRIATGDIFVADSELKDNILSNFDVLACEMEGAAIAYVCKCANIDFAEIRDISDNADVSANDSYWEYRKKYSLAKILYELLISCGDDLL